MQHQKSDMPPDLKKWVDAKKKCRLSQLHICMAIELGIPPRKLGGMGANPHELWKSPLPEYLEELYEKRFGSSRKPVVLSFVQIAESRKKPKAPGQQANEPQERAGPADAISIDTAPSGNNRDNQAIADSAEGQLDLVDDDPLNG